MSIHVPPDLVVVAVDVGKNTLALSATNDQRVKLAGPFDTSMSRTGVATAVHRIRQHLPPGAPVRVGIEAAGHYHLPVLGASTWPPGWELVQLNPAHVAEQRKVSGRRRVKTDAIDLEAITELVLGGRGLPVAEQSAVIGEISALSSHRYRRVEARTALKNELLGQLDRTFPGLSLALADILDAKVGRLVAWHFADPNRLASLGTERFIRYARTRGLRVTHPVAERLVAAARDALPLAAAGPARGVLAADLAMLAAYDEQIATIEDQLAALVPASPFRTLVSVPGWSPARAAAYCAGIGDPDRWPGPRQVYRASGLSPAQYESAGRRRDGTISREGSVALRRALIGLGNGLWHHDRPSREYAAGLRERGKPGKVIACALANRANRIAYALVRDQNTYDPDRWTTTGD